MAAHIAKKTTIKIRGGMIMPSTFLDSVPQWVEMVVVMAPIGAYVFYKFFTKCCGSF